LAVNAFAFGSASPARSEAGQALADAAQFSYLSVGWELSVSQLVLPPEGGESY